MLTWGRRASGCSGDSAVPQKEQVVGLAMDGSRDEQGRVDTVQRVVTGGDPVDVGDQLLERHHTLPCDNHKLSTTRGTTRGCRAEYCGVTLNR
jgi:hypothetical protein